MKFVQPSLSRGTDTQYQGYRGSCNALVGWCRKMCSGIRGRRSFRLRANDWDGGRGDEVRFLGEFDNTPAATAKLVRKLAAKYERLTFCYEAGPTGYGLYRENRREGKIAAGSISCWTRTRPSLQVFLSGG